VSALAARLARLERQAGRRLRQRRCSACITRPSRHVVITEIDADGGVTRQDELDTPVACLQCGWAAAVHMVEIVEVRDWDGVGRHGRW
jgi:hypothetical protein